MNIKSCLAMFASSLAIVAVATYYGNQAKMSPADKEARSASIDRSGSKILWWQDCVNGEDCVSKIMYRDTVNMASPVRISNTLEDVGAPRVSRDGKYATFYGVDTAVKSAMFTYVVDISSSTSSQTPTKIDYEGDSENTLSSPHYEQQAPAISDEILSGETKYFYLVVKDLDPAPGTLTEERVPCEDDGDEWYPTLENISLQRVKIKANTASPSPPITYVSHTLVNVDVDDTGVDTITDGGAFNPTITPNARYIAYTTGACDMPGYGNFQVQLSDCSDGGCVFEDTVSEDLSGNPGDGDSDQADISGFMTDRSSDGNPQHYMVAFTSRATNFPDDNQTMYSDIFVRRLGSLSSGPSIWRAYHGNDDSEPIVSVDSTRPAIDPKSESIIWNSTNAAFTQGPRFVAFQSTSASIEPDGSSPGTPITASYGSAINRQLIFLSDIWEPSNCLTSIESHVMPVVTQPLGRNSYWPDLAARTSIAGYLVFDNPDDDMCGSNSGLSKICRKN